jgi:hypothetical protein
VKGYYQYLFSAAYWRSPQWIGGWVGPRNDLEDVEERKTLESSGTGTPIRNQSLHFSYMTFRQLKLLLSSGAKERTIVCSRHCLYLMTEGDSIIFAFRWYRDIMRVILTHTRDFKTNIHNSKHALPRTHWLPWQNSQVRGSMPQNWHTRHCCGVTYWASESGGSALGLYSECAPFDSQASHSQSWHWGFSHASGKRLYITLLRQPFPSHESSQLVSRRYVP